MKKSHFIAILIFAGAISPVNASTTIDWIGSYASKQSPWKVTIKQDESPQFGYSRRNGVGTALSPSKWRPHAGWFVHIADDLHLWAFDGIDQLLLVQITEEGCTLYDLDSLRINPPAEVLDLLTVEFRKQVISQLNKQKKPNKADMATPRKPSD